MMNKPLAILALLGACLSAHAVQNVELKEYPPLASLHYCQDAGGKVAAQNDACGPGLTEVSSIMTQDGTGKPKYGKLGATLDSPDGPPPPAQATAPAVARQDAAPAGADMSKEESLRRAHHSLMRLLAFCLVFGIVAKLIGRSFILGALLGGIVEVVLVGAAVFQY